MASAAERLFATMTPSPRTSLARRLKAPARVLDLGCGNFAKSYRYVHLPRPQTEIVGVEFSAQTTIYGPIDVDSKVSSTGRFSLVGCDIEAGPLPFEAASFDGVFCSHVIEHVKDRDHVLAEIARILRPGGYAYLETPGPRSLLVKPHCALYDADAPYPYNFRDDQSHVGEPMTLAELRSMLHAHDLLVERSGYHRELGALGMPLYAALFGAGLLPFVPRNVRGRLRGIGYWNLVGWPIFALARKGAGI